MYILTLFLYFNIAAVACMGKMILPTFKVYSDNVGFFRFDLSFFVNAKDLHIKKQQQANMITIMHRKFNKPREKDSILILSYEIFEVHSYLVQ